jgi:hypothetical protein
MLHGLPITSDFCNRTCSGPDAAAPGARRWRMRVQVDRGGRRRLGGAAEFREEEGWRMDVKRRRVWMKRVPDSHVPTIIRWPEGLGHLGTTVRHVNTRFITGRLRAPAKRVTVATGSWYSSPIKAVGYMTRITRRWFRPALLLMLAISAQVPACEYGQHPGDGNGGQTMAAPMNPTTPPAPPTLDV